MLIFSITKFRSLVELPKKSTPEASRLTDDLISSLSLQAELKDFYELFLDLIDVRFGTQGLEFAIEGLQELIKAACRELKFEFSGVVLDAFISFSNAVRSQSLSPNFSGKPFSHANSIIFYLSHRRAQIMSERDGDERWNKLCLIGYLVSRRAVDSSLNTQYELWLNISSADLAEELGFVGINDGQIQGSTRAIIKILLFVDLSKLTEEIPLLIGEDIVEKAMESANSGTKKFDSMYEYYLKWSKLLFSGNPYKRARIKLVEENSDKSSKEEKPTFNKLQKFEQSVSRIYQEDIKQHQKTSSLIEEDREQLLWTKEDNEEIKDGFSPDECEIALLRIGDFHNIKETRIFVRFSKSSAGKRTLPLHLLLDETELKLMMEYLKTIKKSVKTNKKVLKKSFISFPNGESLSPEQIGAEVAKVIKTAELPVHVTAHSLRHAFASGSFAAWWLKETNSLSRTYAVNKDKTWAKEALSQFCRSGIEDRAVTIADDIRRLMGHASLEVTFERYIHTLDLVAADAVRLAEHVNPKLYLNSNAAALLIGITNRQARDVFPKQNRIKLEKSSKTPLIELDILEEELIDRLMKLS